MLHIYKNRTRENHNTQKKNQLGKRSGEKSILAKVTHSYACAVCGSGIVVVLHCHCYCQRSFELRLNVSVSALLWNVLAKPCLYQNRVYVAYIIWICAHLLYTRRTTCWTHSAPSLTLSFPLVFSLSMDGTKWTRWAIACCKQRIWQQALPLHGHRKMRSLKKKNRICWWCLFMRRFCLT